jgi:hypothetical protein
MTRASKEKNREYQHKWYLANKKLQISRNLLRRRKLQEWLKEFKSTLQCNRCSENHPACIDFHHINPNDKLDFVSIMIRKGYSKIQILEEISKCEILCSNCHRKLHWQNNKLNT